jgi:hypothetical protein
MGRRGKWKDDALQWTAEGEFDPELTALSRSSEEQTQYVAPGAEQKWRARDLVDIHWKLFAIECPTSFNRIMSCIIGHANPSTGRCQLKRKLIAAETGYSIETVKRAIKWWVSKKFLVVESTGVGRSNAYHPQWELFELHWIAAADDIEAQKEAWRHVTLQCDAGHQGDPRAGHQGDPRGGQYGDPHESQSRTSKKESHPERVRPPSVADTHVISSEGKKEKEEGIQRGEVESASTSAQRPEGPSYNEANERVVGYCEPFHWEHLTQEEFDAAIAAEIVEVGANRCGS